MLYTFSIKSEHYSTNYSCLPIEIHEEHNMHIFFLTFFFTLEHLYSVGFLFPTRERANHFIIHDNLCTTFSILVHGECYFVIAGSLDNIISFY